MMRSRTVSLVAAALIAVPPGAFANPLGGQVVGGQAIIAGQGTSTVTVTQGSQNAIINWYTFNIGAGEKTQFIQPNAGSIALNRVTGGQGVSTIYGTLTANGRVFLINPDGIMIGPGGVVNAAGFLASTNNIKDSDFMAGNYKFNIPGKLDASIVNLGQITASNGGFAALVAPGVRNAGTITANLGTVALASGNGFTLDFYGDKLITLQVGDKIANQVIDVATQQPLGSLVKNEGTLKANGGQVVLTAAAARHVVDSVINTSGVIEANSVGMKNGMIVLGGATAATKGTDAPTQTVKVSGTLKAKGHKAGEKGGVIQITGEDIQVTGAKINASGQAGGGTVLIGGDTGGGTVNAAVSGVKQAQLQTWSVANASSVSIDAATTINASAKSIGDGGKVVVWSNDATKFAGTIYATGGLNGGNGGFAEVSSHGALSYSGYADLSAVKGSFGTLLLDPFDLTICDKCDTSGVSGFTSTHANSQLNVSNLTTALGGANVVVTTGAGDTDQLGNITVAAPISWSAPTTLTLSAANNIYLDQSITTGLTGGLTLNAGNNISAGGAVNVGTFTLQKGFWSQVTTDVLPSFSANDFRLTGGTFLRANGGRGTFGGVETDASPYQIVDVYGLQGIGSPSGALLNKNFVLANNIDASGTKNWNGGTGFVPIGTAGNPFTGMLDGSQQFGEQGSVWSINNVTIAPTNANITTIGLFGANAGMIQNLQLTNASITANPHAGLPGQFVGTLVGQNWGSVSNVSASGQIDGKNLASVIAGGLVGQNGMMGQEEQSAQITNSHANVKVTLGDGISCFGTACNGGWNNAGGLVGVNVATIDTSWASGDVIVGANSFAGGLVGSNQNSTSPSTSPGGSSQPQPLPGPVIVDSWASGNVSSSAANVALGGLVGYNAPLALIATSFASGNVTSTASVNSGGNDCSTTNSCQFANVGGLVGQNQGEIFGFQSTDSPALTTALATTATTGCVVGQTCASGAVSVGSGGTAGGLVGFNDGIILNTFATGAVIGAAGVANGKDSFGHTTNLGGLVGGNQGIIANSSASGNVGTAGIAFLMVGGLVADNGGMIIGSSANNGSVQAGDHSQAGGLSASNGAWDNNCGACTHGDGYNLLAGLSFIGVNAPPTTTQFGFGVITNSSATGNVSVGAFSLAGGFVGATGNSNNSASAAPLIDQSWASGAVGGGGNSILGGFAGVQDIGGTIRNSQSSGDVRIATLTPDTGANSIAAGFIGVNGGAISNSQSSGAVRGISSSYLGGFVGINIGSIDHSTNTGVVTGSGDGNVAGGFVATNVGSIDWSTTTGQVSSGPNSVIGGFAGGNLSFDNLPSNFTIPNSNFPHGTITNSSIVPPKTQPAFAATDAVNVGGGTTATTNVLAPSQFIGSTNTAGYPGLPSILSGCDAALCQLLLAGLGSGGGPPDNGTTPTFNVLTPPTQQFAPPTFTNNNNTPIQINLTNPGPGPGGPAGGNGGTGNGGNGGVKPNYGPPPGAGLGRTLDEQQFSGVPPPGETRFRTGQLVIQVVDTVPVADVVGAAQKLGLVLISVQHLDETKRNAFVFRATAANADLRKLIPMLEKINIVASVQPNYNFIAGQTAPAPAAPSTVPAAPAASSANPAEVPDLANADTAALSSLPAGDAAQYVIDKFHLGAVHRLASGRNVTIAVIDSEIDAAHPDLRGSIIERFDATQSASKPHSHGTGMAGAIVSRTRLLGVAPGARIIAIKAFDESATSAEATSFQILKGLDYAIAKNVRIINMSFAGPRDPMMERTLKSAHDKGIILIAAAGNAGPKSPPLYPGADASVIAVSATDYADKPFAMANRGRYIAVAAPGVDVMVPAPANSYQLTTGTSVAAAHVSGVAALILERKPTMTPDELRALLMKTSTAFSSKPKGEEDGAGLVDPVGALQALAAARTSDTVPASRAPTASAR